MRSCQIRRQMLWGTGSSDVALELAEQNCRMFSVQEYEESLESYYLNLVGGGKHE